MTASQTRRAIDAVLRIESAKIVAGLARVVRDGGLAEELAQDALVSALEQPGRKRASRTIRARRLMAAATTRWCSSRRAPSR